MLTATKCGFKKRDLFRVQIVALKAHFISKENGGRDFC